MFHDLRIPPLTPLPVAHLGSRLAAALLDFVAMGAFIILLTTTWPGGDGASSPFENLLVWALIGLFVATYSQVTTSRWGGTPGKLICRLRVVAVRDGGPLGYGRALLRHVSHVVMWTLPVLSLLNVAYCLWDRPLRQCLHDKIVSSVVVRCL
ncbi:putative RDD family membrane protein YckC [Nonomuraea thailandensis]|uniref:RDD family membrane protein YckC n=1 Tax=Nonomuraea thailandensis TaxID=1188745 RepID=A0A9X2K1D2_9ACTN|nr:RDD family protein [Nonomuraea thailandensis]MCP2357157.1 putative RDD family membrane protein YckC [Nonomuraea thailandensis]